MVQMIRITPEELRTTYRLGRLSREAARQLVGVDKRTWQRWEAGKARIPHAAFALLKVVAKGELPGGAGPDWEGFRFIRGLLYTPDGEEISPGDARALAWNRRNGRLYCLGAPCRNAQPRRSASVIELHRRRAQLRVITGCM